MCCLGRSPPPPLIHTPRNATDRFERFNLEQTGKIWNANLVWKFMMAPMLLPPVDFARGCRDLARRQAVSHMLGVARPLIDKDSLVRTMAYAGVAAGDAGPDVDAPVLPLPSWMPETVVVTVRAGRPAEEWRGWPEFAAAHAAHEAKADGGRNLWLIKPTSANRGQGIELVTTPAAAAAHLAKVAPTDATNFVLQKYLEEPLLVDGRKFDVRVWTLWVGCGGKRFQVYVFPEGYVRTSSNRYSLDAEDKFVHLTNYCLQSSADNETFGEHETGNSLTFAELDERVRSEGRRNTAGDAAGGAGDPESKEGKEEMSVSERMMDDARKIITTSARAVDAYLRAPRSASERAAKPARMSLKERMMAKRLKERGGGKESEGKADATAAGDDTRWEEVPTGASGRQHQFELLGYDILLDAHGGSHLLEVNVNPSLHYQSDWHTKLVDEMLESAFRTAVDPVFEIDAAAAADAIPARPMELLFDSAA